MKKLFDYCSPGSALYVILHGQWQKSRGRNLSATFGAIANPRLALKAAIEKFWQKATLYLPSLSYCPLPIARMILQRLGLRNLSDSETSALLESFQISQRQSVPSLEWRGDRWHFTWPRWSFGEWHERSWLICCR